MAAVHHPKLVYAQPENSSAVARIPRNPGGARTACPENHQLFEESPSNRGHIAQLYTCFEQHHITSVLGAARVCNHGFVLA